MLREIHQPTASPSAGRRLPELGVCATPPSTYPSSTRDRLQTFRNRSWRGRWADPAHGPSEPKSPVSGGTRTNRLVTFC